MHPEERPRHERMRAQRFGEEPFNWRGAANRLIKETPPGIERLHAMYKHDSGLNLFGESIGRPKALMDTIIDVLTDAASDGALLVEVRFGSGSSRPDLMRLFREAEIRAQQLFPGLFAEAIGHIPVSAASRDALNTAERRLENCFSLVDEGLSGLDFLIFPYGVAAPHELWDRVADWSRYAHEQGLGITVHAGEFSEVDIEQALNIPGLIRMGHAVGAAERPDLLSVILKQGITVECCLSSNVLLGAVPSYEEHPIRKFMKAGIPVTLNTDDPIRVGTTIEREYTIAATLGITTTELLGITRNAVKASFTTKERREILLDEIDSFRMSMMEVVHDT